MKQGFNLINGKWFSTSDYMEVTNPATEEVFARVPLSGEAEAAEAADAAYEAFLKWSKETAETRSNVLYKWHQLITEHREEIAEIMTMEQGKPFDEALGEVDYANQYVKFYAEEATRIKGEIIPASSKNKRILVQKEAVGVVAAITPWNFPAAMITRKLAPALAAGNTVLLKPSQETPLTAIRLVELAEQAGVPAGGINILTGSSREITGVWQADSRVRKITFTGSTPVGKQIMKDAADTMKKISLELGGHAPFIVTEHADIDKAVQGAMSSKFRNGGQACVAANRFYVHERVAEEFTNRFVEEVKKLRTGNGMEKSTTLGPLINQKAVEKVKEHIADATAKGAVVLTGGASKSSAGFFHEATILGNVTDDMLCMYDETFGPLAPITTFKTMDEVISRANHTPYGLAAYVFTENIAEIMELSGSLEYGIVGVNDGAPSTAQAPFGGYKESGLGREGGDHGIHDYLEVKYVSLGF